MGAKTYKVRALVLKKTKLAEKDLIITMLAEDGALVKGVAKGARKPGGSFAARLELFSTVDAMLAQGRSLDVVCEARLVDAAGPRVFELDSAACASPISELLCAIAQPDLSQPRLFDIARAAFAAIADPEISDLGRLAVASAALWKVMAQAGFRPSFAACALCGNSVDDLGGADSVAVSVVDGGIVCDTCPRPADAIVMGSETIRWCDAFIRTRFADLAEIDAPPSTIASTFDVARMWARAHTGKDLKSIDFLFTSSLL